MSNNRQITIAVDNDEDFIASYDRFMVSPDPEDIHEVGSVTFVVGGSITGKVYCRIRNDMIVSNILGTGAVLGSIKNPPLRVPGPRANNRPIFANRRLYRSPSPVGSQNGDEDGDEDEDEDEEEEEEEDGDEDGDGDEDEEEEEDEEGGYEDEEDGYEEEEEEEEEEEDEDEEGLQYLDDQIRAEIWRTPSPSEYSDDIFYSRRSPNPDDDNIYNDSESDDGGDPYL